MFMPGGIRGLNWIPPPGPNVQAVITPNFIADGITDNTTILNNALAAAQATGGVIVFPAGRIMCTGQIVMPNTGGVTPLQPTITLIGQGAGFGASQPASGGTVLALRFSGTNAKLLTLGFGKLAIYGISFVEDGSSGTSTPFIYTTNTVLDVRECSFFGFNTLTQTSCIQDAIILGGTSGVVGNTPSGAFQGYGTIIRDCQADHIRRFAYLRSSCNNAMILNNTVWINSGSNLAGGACIEIDGSGSSADGNVIAGNLVEVSGYPYGYKVTVGVKNIFDRNSAWDESGTTLAYYRFESGTLFNSVIHGHGKTGGIPIFSDANAAPSTNAVIGWQSGQTSYWPQNLTVSGNLWSSPFTTPQGPFGVSLNTAVNLPAILSGTMGVWSNADAAGTRLELMSFGASVSNTLSGRVGGNTGASPAATPNGSIMWALNGFGFDGASWLNAAQIFLTAAETWSTGHQGTNYKVQTTQAGTTARTTCWQTDLNFNSVIGPTAAIANNATDGFMYIPRCDTIASAGSPSGTPTAFTGKQPMFYDTVNNKLWAFNSTWKGTVFS